MERCAGGLLATILKGVWRRGLPSLAISAEELRWITPLLLQSGAGALGWYRIRQCEARTFPVARQLRQAYRLHTIRTALHERALQQVFAALRSAGVEPIAIKGWAVGRLYPEPGLRPYGDLDIVVRPEQHAAATSVMADMAITESSVDLHRGLPLLADRKLEALYARSETLQLGDMTIRTLGAEDHLALLARHFLRHNAWRPLWLCDIAAALEARPPDFHWDRCLSGHRYAADWVACTLGLAHQLLGARVEDTPVAYRANHLPSWLVPAVLRQWNRCRMPGFTGTVVRYLTFHWRKPRQIVQEARLRWDMPIAATVALGGPFNEFPRTPFQLGLALAHVPVWCQELGTYLTKKRALGPTNNQVPPDLALLHRNPPSP